MRPQEWLLASVFSVWGLASFAVQAHAGARRWLQRVDVAGLLPTYRFYAPTPAFVDYHLEVRTRLASGEPGPWVQPFPDRGRTWLSTIWNPHLQAAMARNELLARLASRVQLQGVDAMESSLAHAQIVALVRHSQRGGESIQWRVRSGGGFDPAKPPVELYQSAWEGPAV